MTQQDRSSTAVFPAVSGAETPVQAVLTVSEVATLLRVSEDSVYRHRKELGGFRLGRRVLFRRDRLEAYTEAPGGPPGALERPRLTPMTPTERKAWRAHVQDRALQRAGS